jgi:hypothetical protein
MSSERARSPAEPEPRGGQRPTEPQPPLHFLQLHQRRRPPAAGAGQPHQVGGVVVNL